MHDSGRPHVILLYHYFHPDDVVSARLFSDLAVGLRDLGWDVTAIPANRDCHNQSKEYPLSEDWNGIRIRRTWRPAFQASSTLGRMANAIWMIGSWGLAGFTARRRRHEVMVVGTDPILGVLAAVPWRVARRKTGIVHWCHDLYPEAPVAEGMLRADAGIVRGIKWLLSKAYHRCDVIADLGPCMRALLNEYGSPARATTLTPWALVEPAQPPPPNPSTRQQLFGDAALGILYSGNFGRAHSYEEFLALARSLRNSPVHICLAGRGNRMAQIKAAITPDDSNITFAGFAPEEELEKRLSACDLHLVSLRPEWAGTVVPSKFFGAIATGRGVIFAGPPESAIGRWIREYDVGWILTPETQATVAQDLRRLADRPEDIAALRSRCHIVYQEHFSKSHQIQRWDAELRAVLDQRSSG